MAKEKSILSSAELIAELLEDDPRVKALGASFFPIIAPEKVGCPYIVYRIGKLFTRADSVGHADTGQIEVICCGASYRQMVEISEATRMALDGVRATSDDGSLVMRSCVLTGASEGYESQTFVRTLIFTVKIN